MTLFGIRGQAKGEPRWIYEECVEEIVFILGIGHEKQCKILPPKISCLANMAYPLSFAA
jgi:hypothetical protein